MSFKREGIDCDAINLVKRRRVEELLSEDIPEDEATLTKNGRFACLVCANHPVLDTVEMLCIHRGGKKHKSYEEHFFRKKREFHQLVEKRRQEASLPRSNDKQAILEAPLLLQARKSQSVLLRYAPYNPVSSGAQSALLRYAPYNPVSSGAQSAQNIPEDFKTKRSKKKGFFEYTKNYLTNNVPLKTSQERFPVKNQNSPTTLKDPDVGQNVVRGHIFPRKGSESAAEDHFVIKPYVSKRKQSKMQMREDKSQSAKTTRKVLDADRTMGKTSEVGSSYSWYHSCKWKVNHREIDDCEEKDLKRGGEESFKGSDFTQHPISEYPPVGPDCDLNVEEADGTNTRRSNNVIGHERKMDMDRGETSVGYEGLQRRTVQLLKSNSRRDGHEIPGQDLSPTSASTTLQQSVTNIQGGKDEGHFSRQRLKIDKSKAQYDHDLQDNHRDGVNKSRTGHSTTGKTWLHVGGGGGRPTCKMKEGKTCDLESSSEEYLTNSGNPKTGDLSSKCPPHDVDGQNVQQKQRHQPVKIGPPVKFSFMNNQTRGSSAAQKLSDNRTTFTGCIERTSSIMEKSKDIKKNASVLGMRKSKYSDERKRELNKHLELTSSGWIHDPSGRWVKDENVEFDSDEEEPVTK